MEGKTAAPVLPGLPAHIECELEQIVDTHGDHAVVILRVVEAECQERVRPLTMAATPWNYGGWSEERTRPEGITTHSDPAVLRLLLLFKTPQAAWKHCWD